MNDSIKKMLGIVEKDSMTTEVSHETPQKKETLIVNAVLSPAPRACRSCGSTVVNRNGKTIIMKNGKEGTIVRFEQYNHMSLVIRLKKRHYTHKNYRTHWAVQDYSVQLRHSIANHARYEIASLLTEKVSLSFTAESCQVSLITVIRTLKGFKSYLPKQSRKILPRVLMVDESRPHTSIEDKVSSICVDGEAGKLVDVLSTHKLPRLTSYFLGCTNPEEIEFLMTDMNVTYFQFAKRVLPNAKAVIGRFHIVKHMNQAFNELHIREMNELRKAGQRSQAEKLKKSWCLLLENRTNISHCEHRIWKSFRVPKYPFPTETTMTDQLLEFSPPLREAYPFFHELVEAFRDRDPDLFLSLLAELPETLDDGFRKKFQNLLIYEEDTINTMIYPCPNRRIEAENTHVKTMRRVSYEFKSPENMRIRISLVNQLINVR